MSRIPLLALVAALLLVMQIRAGFAANSYEDASKLFKQGNYARASWGLVVMTVSIFSSAPA